MAEWIYSVFTLVHGSKKYVGYVKSRCKTTCQIHTKISNDVILVTKRFPFQQWRELASDPIFVNRQFNLTNMFIRWRVIAVQFINEALRSPNHKTCFSFALGCIQNFNFPIHFRRFSPVSTQPHQNGQAWCKSCVHLSP